IIGFPFFARFKTTVDYANLQITLEKSDYQPDDVMQAVMKSVFESKQKPVTTASAGQWGITVSKDTADADPGVTISNVFQGTPAAAAGVQVNDRLMTIDSMWTDSEIDCLRAAATVPPGNEVSVQIRRGDRILYLQIRPRAGF